MSIFDQELILPGVITDIISDYSEGYDTSAFGTTDSVAIIGTAFDGPVGRPVKIYSPEHARYVFGNTFDSKTKREATLVAEIQDAWDRGCRTIYAVRISGKDIYKDFQLASSKCKLRVSGIFPSNLNKEIYFKYEKTNVALGTLANIKIYKPSNRATIEEKMLGKVLSDNSILINSIDLLNSWNVTESTRLVDFIQLFNSYSYNNVLKLAIVNEEGEDISASEEGQALSFGDLLPGIYFIGRDSNSASITPKTVLNYKVLTTDEEKQNVYQGFTENVVKSLECNTDITKDLPIYHSDITELNELIGEVVSMSKLFDFIEVYGKVDDVWPKNSIDYEEVELGDFEAYKRLGSGFATNAKIVETKPGSNIYKVVEVTDVTDGNRVTGITDGVYSMMENLTADYRVLTGKYADTVIKSTLPKKNEFLISNPKANKIFDEKVLASAKVEKNDLSKTSKKYQFDLIYLDEESDLFDKETVLEKLFSPTKYYNVAKIALPIDDTANSSLLDEIILDETRLMIGAADVTLEDGELALISGVLYKAKNGILEKINVEKFKSEYEKTLIVSGSDIYKMDTETTDSIKFVKITNASDLNYAKYIAASKDEDIMLYEIKGTSVTPVAYLNEVLEDSTEIFTSMIEEVNENSIVNKISIYVPNLELMSLVELATTLNNSERLSKLFEFNIVNSDLNEQLPVFVDEDGVGVFSNPGIGNKVNKDEKVIEDRGPLVYDTSLYIPYKTTDNFARQLAQHCIYTGLKTAPTHGIIGCSKILSTNLTTIANKVDKLVNLDLNLYSKKSNGNDMLDRNNMPYPIGRALSVTAFQHTVETYDNYTYTATGASAYAGMVSTLPIDQSSTSQTINLNNISYELTNYQLGRLTQAGYVTVKDSYTKGFVVTDGVTMAPSTSSFRRLSISRIINGIDEALRTVSEPYIGKQNHMSNRNSLQTAIKSVLDKMLNNLIERYDFTLVNDNAATRLGIIEIEYTIIPIYEIREIRNRVTVRDNSTAS